jgi:hypothetical protein
MASYLEQEIMRSMGFIPKEPVQGPQGSVAGRPHALGWKSGQRVAVPTPVAGQAGYGAAMDRFSNRREHVSPLGGTAGWPWDQRPPVGEASLRPEFRRSRGGRS